MLTFTRNRTSPVGLSIARTSANLVELTGTLESFSLRTAVQYTLPDVTSAASPEAADQTVAETLRTMVNDHRLRGRKVVSCLKAY